MKKIYLSGPMTGLPEFNHPAFHAEADRLRDLGYTVVNPAELNPDLNATRAACLRNDIKGLMECDTIAMLSGWHRSKGASLERSIAIELGMTVLGASYITYPIEELRFASRAAQEFPFARHRHHKGDPTTQHPTQEQHPVIAAVARFAEQLEQHRQQQKSISPIQTRPTDKNASESERDSQPSTNSEESTSATFTNPRDYVEVDIDKLTKRLKSPTAADVLRLAVDQINNAFSAARRSQPDIRQHIHTAHVEAEKTTAPDQKPANTHQIGGTHYTSQSIQPWDAMQAWLKPDQFVGFLAGNVIKYSARWQNKDGINDLRKARHYLDKLCEVLTKPEPWPEVADEQALNDAACKLASNGTTEG